MFTRGHLKSRYSSFFSPTTLAAPVSVTNRHLCSLNRRSLGNKVAMLLVHSSGAGHVNNETYTSYTGYTNTSGKRQAANVLL